MCLRVSGVKGQWVEGSELQAQRSGFWVLGVGFGLWGLWCDHQIFGAGVGCWGSVPDAGAAISGCGAAIFGGSRLSVFGCDLIR